MANSMEGQETVHSVCGPIAHSVAGMHSWRLRAWHGSRLTVGADLRLFITSVLGQEPWKYDSKVVPLPWRQSEEDAIKAKLSAGGLTLGFYNCDGNVRNHQTLAVVITDRWMMTRSSRTHPSSAASRPSSRR